jgi:hypothetical protein
MHVVTDAEVLKWIGDTKRPRGVRADSSGLYYEDPGANCFELQFPETPLSISYITRIVAMMDIGDESLFCGAVLWITLSNIGSPQLEKSGWKLLEKMRQGFGENRDLQTASGHSFRSDELVDLTAFLVPCFVFGWDAYVISNASSDFFIFISHDEYWGVVARTKEAYDKLFFELKDLNPKESPGMRKQFCRSSA